jgi:GPI mannosyltransferase 3
MTISDSAGAPASMPRGVARMLAALCGASLLVKTLIYWTAPNLGNPDETFQYMEQAHRLVFGTGLVPWEFIVGVRSWLLPGLLVPGVALARALGTGAEFFPASSAAVCALLSLLPILCGGHWGWRANGTAGAVIAAALNAFWFESVYYGDHVLSEAIAADFLVAGLYLAYPATPAEARRRLYFAGLCFGAVVAFRLQLAPAILVALAGICRLTPRAYIAVGAGMLGPVLLLGLIDWISWGRPFQSVELYLLINYSADAASRFGVDPWYQYALWEGGYWSFATLPIVPLAIFGARRLPLLLLVAVTIYAAHAMIPHKEPRFVFPALPLVLTLVGLGTSDLLSRWSRPVSAATIGAVFWISVSALLGSFGFFAAYWTVGAGMITAMRAVNAHPASCGLAIAPGNLWWRTGGYTRLRPGLSIYGLEPGDADAPSQSAAYSDIVATGDDPLAPQPDFASLGFHKEGCWENGRNRAAVCLWRRAGACDPNATAPLVPNVPDDIRGIVDQLRH